jgi:uncharacterized protein YjbI with pentapeptide repeats/predicted RNA-binding protein with RPS1 domain/tetratricopeptide (TPR) repeat protein
VTAPVTSARAAEMLASVRRSSTDGALRLAYHAALPVVIDSGLLNLLRVNFFLDPPDVLPYEAEAELLLSPLFREIGDDLYEIDPEVRNTLLLGLQSRYGPQRVREVALLLELYTETTMAWNGQPELEQAQRLTALSFVDPARAEAWLESAHSQGPTAALGREWFVAMRERIAAQPGDADMASEIATARNQLSGLSLEIRLGAIRTLTALAQLPDCDVPGIVDTLALFIRDRTAPPQADIHADAQAALSLLGRLPRAQQADLRGVVLGSADLSDLDLSNVILEGASMAGCRAARVNLTAADLLDCTMTSVRAPWANLSDANLSGSTLVNVDLRGANLTDADLSGAWLRNVDFSGAVLRSARLPGTREALFQEGVKFAGADLTGALFIDPDQRPPPPPPPPEPDAAAPEAEAAGAGPLTIDQVRAGQIRRGLVQAVDPDGVIVNLGGLLGRIDGPELSWNELDDPSEVVRIGEPVVVEVIGVDPDGGRIALSLKATQERSWRQFASMYQIGQVVPGVVTSLVNFGAFVQIAESVQGLIHVSELADHPVDEPGEIVQVGDEIFVKIIDIDIDRHRVSLSLQQANELDPGASDLDFDPVAYGMPMSYDAEGNYLYPEGYDPDADEWLQGYEAQRDEFERQYNEARARYEGHRRQLQAVRAKSGIGELTTGPGSIFVSYRREDAGYAPALLHERLIGHFGRERVFPDVAAIQVGDDFAEQLTVAVESSKVLLALIGPRWVTDLRPRLDDPTDFVRFEIETALSHNVAVVPVLVDGAEMPDASELPDSLNSLAFLSAYELRSSNFDHDVDRLLLYLDSYLGPPDQQEPASEPSQADLDDPSQQAGPDREVDLDADIERAYHELETKRHSATTRAALLSNLGAMLRTRFERTGEFPDLDEAVRLGEDSVKAARRRDRNRAGYLSNLSSALHTRYRFGGALADLDRAVSLGEDALAAAPANDDTTAILSNLSVALKTRSDRTGSLADLNRAIDVAEQALAPLRSDRAGYGVILSNLAIALRARYERTGNPSDLDQAISYGQAALHATGPEDPSRGLLLNNLGLALRQRFIRSGAPEDADRAVEMATAAIAAVTPASPDYPTDLANLSAALLARYNASGSNADVDGAVEAARRAHEAAGEYPAHPDRARAAVMLGNALRASYENTGNQADLDAAIRSLREAANDTPPDNRNYAVIQSGLGAALLSRHEAVFSEQNLDESIASFRKAADTSSSEDDRIRNLGQLADALTRRIHLIEAYETGPGPGSAGRDRRVELPALLDYLAEVRALLDETDSESSSPETDT